MPKEYIHRCDYCDEQFQRRDRHGNRNKHFFCSSKCAAEFKTKKILVSCDWCDNKFYKKTSDINRSERNFCCHKCSENFIRGTGLRGLNPKVYGIPNHRRLAEKKIGRSSLHDEEVHHVDGNHLNNKPDNLVVMKAGEHSSFHASRKRRESNGRFAKSK